MKRKLSLLIMLTLFVLTVFTMALIGCGGGDENEGPKVDYSVTVVDAADEPVPDITVSWMRSGKAKAHAVTDENGKATASIPSGTYTVNLSGYDEGLAYTEISVNAAMPNVRLTLSVAKVLYTATVIDKSGVPASNVTVTWSNETSTVGSAVTNASGVAEKELDYGDYTVTVTNLPQNNVFTGGLEANGKNPSVRFELNDGVTQSYKVTVLTEGKLRMSGLDVVVYTGSSIVTIGTTDANGEFTFNQVAGEYSVYTNNLPEGYSAAAATLTASSRETQIILKSKVIESAPTTVKRYVLGNIIHDYSFTTPYPINGAPQTYSIADLINNKRKKAVIINNWGTQCSNCIYEMPAMNDAYKKYADDIEIIAVSNYLGGDSNTVIKDFYERYGYEFPMMRDTNQFTTRFGITGWPTTVIVDRFGAIARIEVGAVVEQEVWERLIEMYIGDDYTQTFVPGDEESPSINNEASKPDVTVDDDHYEKMAEAINNTAEFPAGASVTYYGETEYEYAWPFMYKTVDGVSENNEVVLYSSNTTKPNSMSILYANVIVDIGQVLTFDYYSDTEENADILSILWDGKIIKEISGKSDGWKTCYLYSDITSGAHTLSMTYIKDNSVNTGKDNVYFRNIRFVPISAISEPTDMLRAAAYGTPDKGDSRFPYYATVELNDTDGYYYVDLSKLENASLAGNDDKPMLFANLLNATNWSGNSFADYFYAIDETTGEYIIDCTFTVNSVTKDYRTRIGEILNVAAASDITYCIPVDDELKGIMIEFVKAVENEFGNGDGAHENEWLELCYFYSHYGTGEFIGNPIIGLTTKTAVVIGEGRHTTHLTRNMHPFPVEIFTFTPESDGIYCIQSYIPSDQAALYASQIWLYDDNTSETEPLLYCGDSYITRDGVNEHNFKIYRYMTAEHKYYIALAYQLAASGIYDFSIEKIAEPEIEVLTPCSDGYYLQVLDKYGNFNGEVVLSGAVKYVKDGSGNYHAVNPDGTMGSYIYLDVKYALSVLGDRAIKDIVDAYAKDPKDGKTNLSYKTFDLSKRVIFLTNTDGTLDYDPEQDISSWGEKYKDYTDFMKSLVEQGLANTGDEEGLVIVNDEIVTVLLTYIETRNNMMLDGKTEKLLENEWLRFCWYYRLYNSENV